MVERGPCLSCLKLREVCCVCVCVCVCVCLFSTCTYRCKLSLAHISLTHQHIPTDSCDWASPCNSGVCFSNTTGCPTTGLHRIMTNHTTLTPTSLTPTPLTNDEFHMYYRSLLVTVVLVVLGVVTMCLTISCQGGR